MTAIDQLPADLSPRIHQLGYFSVPLDTRADQAAAKGELLTAWLDGPVEALPDALSHVAVAWSTDINGKRIPLSRSWVNRTASQLSQAVRDWLEQRSQLTRAA